MQSSISIACVVVVLCGASLEAQVPFLRSDANLDGNVDISDGVNMLNVLFIGTPSSGCDDARDSNDDGVTDLSDGVYVFNFLFIGGAAPRAPFPACGCDETEDALNCESVSAVCSEAPPCGSSDCLDQDALDAAIADNVPPIVCVPADATQLELEDLVITVCPSDLDPPPTCNEEPGCPVEFGSINGMLDLDANNVRASVTGNIEAMPLSVLNTSLALPPTICEIDLEFSGEFDIPYTTRTDAEGNTVLETIESPIFDRDSVELELDASGGLICAILAGLVDQPEIRDALLDQLDAAAEGLLEDLNAQLSGQILCPAE